MVGIGWVVVAAAVAGAVAGVQGQAAGRAVLAGVDHVPVAVRDLRQAGETYRRLGFVLKPGTPHANGISNLHAKFPDGTEIELITVPRATDALTTTYVEHLKQGDGPASLAFHAPDQAVAAQMFPREHPARRYIFFGGLNRSPTDRPEHFQHPNTAESLVSVWLAADDFRAERDLLRRSNVPIATEDAFVPRLVSAPVVRFERSSVVLLPASHQRVAGRRIVGATVAVRSLGGAAQALRAGGIPPQALTTVSHVKSVFVSPDAAHGWWIEFREK
jgi:hypothetical protein